MVLPVFSQPTTTASSNTRNPSPVHSTASNASKTPRGSPSSAQGVSFSSQFSDFSHHRAKSAPPMTMPSTPEIPLRHQESLRSPPTSLPRHVHYQPNAASPSTYGADTSGLSSRRISSDPPGQHSAQFKQLVHPEPKHSPIPPVSSSSIAHDNHASASSASTHVGSPPVPTGTTPTSAPGTPVSILKRTSAFPHDKIRSFTPAERHAAQQYTKAHVR